MAGFTRLTGTAMELILDETGGGIPVVLHWGAALGPLDPASLKALQTRQTAGSALDMPAPLSLLPEMGYGFFGHPGIEASRDRRGWATRFLLKEKAEQAHGVTYRLEDPNLEAELSITLTLDPASDVLAITPVLTNTGKSPLTLQGLASGTLPLPHQAKELLTFEGRWAYEFQTRRQAIPMGQIVQENRKGRTGHDAFPAMIAGTPHFSNEAGEVWGLHLGWSGNSRIMAERLTDNEPYFQAGALLLPGEITLASGECFSAPTLYASHSDRGLNGLSQNFHRFVRSNLQTHSTAKPRTVHLNIWEAVYFDHGTEKLKALATRAADNGVERFVVDDGWFRHRRHDRAGLGDWYVDETIYPEGLGPLIDHVRGLGMEFGIWVEPEMVNRDSDLFRAHPDWILGVPDLDPIEARNQLVLDLTKGEVFDYLLERLAALLGDHDIAYVKWDMNRNLSHPGSDGIASVHKQTEAVYRLIDTLHERFPEVEIETCASGGARPDFGILARTDRIWTSDNNDALDRLSIMEGASLFLPLQVLGSHVGAEKSHISGRRHAMAYRAAIALFGHMGLELDLDDVSERDLETLKRLIALYKEKRGLLHSGDLCRLDTEEELFVRGVVAEDKSEALFLVASHRSRREGVPPRIRFAGLAGDKTYRLKLRAPARPFGPEPNVLQAADLCGKGIALSGRALMKAGVQLPHHSPEFAMVLEAIAEPG